MDLLNKTVKMDGYGGDNQPREGTVVVVKDMGEGRKLLTLEMTKGYRSYYQENIQNLTIVT